MSESERCFPHNDCGEKLHISELVDNEHASLAFPLVVSHEGPQTEQQLHKSKMKDFKCFDASSCKSSASNGNVSVCNGEEEVPLVNFSGCTENSTGDKSNKSQHARKGGSLDHPANGFAVAIPEGNHKILTDSTLTLHATNLSHEVGKEVISHSLSASSAPPSDLTSRANGTGMAVYKGGSLAQPEEDVNTFLEPPPSLSATNETESKISRTLKDNETNRVNFEPVSSNSLDPCLIAPAALSSSCNEMIFSTASGKEYSPIVRSRRTFKTTGDDYPQTSTTSTVTSHNKEPASSTPSTYDSRGQENAEPDLNSDVTLGNKSSLLVSKLPVKTATTVCIKDMAKEMGSKSSDRPREVHSKDDSFLESARDNEAVEFERCLSAAENGEKRRSRGLWSQSWNPETIIHRNVTHTSATTQSAERSVHDEIGSESPKVPKTKTLVNPNNTTKQVNVKTDENDNYFFSEGIIRENSEAGNTSGLTTQPRKSATSVSELRSMVPRLIRSTTSSSVEEMGIRRDGTSDLESPKSPRTSRLNISDSCIPVNTSGTARNVSNKRERPTSAGTVLGVGKSSDSVSSPFLSKSLSNEQRLSDANPSGSSTLGSFPSSSSDSEIHDLSLTKVTTALHQRPSSLTESASETFSTPFNRAAMCFGPISSTPIKLPGAAKEATRQKQVMEVSPSFDHLSGEVSSFGRPPTLYMNDLDSYSEDGCHSDGGQGDRWHRESVQTLKNRHSRQIQDLQAYYEAELRRLQEEISDLHRRVVSRPSSSPMIRLKYLEQIREELDQRCQQFERRNNQLQEDCERWSQRCFEMERRCRASECERQAVYERCGRLEQEKRKVEVELLKTQEMLNESFRERRQLEERFLELQKREISRGGMLLADDNSLVDVQSQLQSMRELCASKDDMIRQLEQQRNELKKNLDNTISQVDELKQTMGVSSKDRDLFQKLLEEYEALYRQHQKMRAMYKDAIDKMESNAVEVDVLKGLLSKLESDCSKLRESKELFGSSGDNKSKIPVRADSNQIKKKDSVTRRDLFKPTLNIFQTPSSSSLDLTASDNESVSNEKVSEKQRSVRHRNSSASDKSKDSFLDKHLRGKSEDLTKSKGERESFYAGSIWEAAERENARIPVLSSRVNKDSASASSAGAVMWSVPFSEEKSKQKHKGEELSKRSSKEREFVSDSDTSKQGSPAMSRKEQNWVIENRGGVTRFDIVFDTPNRIKPLKSCETNRPEKELDAYGPVKKYSSTKDTYCASSADDSESSFMMRFSSSETSSPRLQTKKDYKAGRTSTLLAGEKDSKAYEERKLKVSDLEQEFKKLTLERESIESQLRKIPTGRTTRKKLDEKEELERRLDQVLKRIGTVKMSLRRFDAL